jgi:hypothetical protein
MREYDIAVKAVTEPVLGSELRKRFKIKTKQKHFNLVLSTFSLADLALKWTSVADKFKLLTSSGETLRQLIEAKLVPKAIEVLKFLRRIVSPDDSTLLVSQQLKICVVLKKQTANADALQNIAKVICFCLVCFAVVSFFSCGKKKRKLKTLI